MKKIALISLIPIIIDQIIKIIITTNIEINDTITIIKNFFNITYIKNFGAAFSILNGNRYFLISIAILAIFIILYFLIKDKSTTKIEAILYSVLLGGIFGNLIDRIVHGYVIDYLEFTIFGHYFPVFNFADMCIVITAFLIIIITIRGEKNEISSRK